MGKTTLKKKLLISLLAAGMVGSFSATASAMATPTKEEGHYVIRNKTIENNVMIWIDDDLVVENSVFKNNSSTGSGPTGMWLEVGAHVGHMTFTNSEFTGNTAINTGTSPSVGSAGSGAALFIKGSEVTFNDTVFKDNVVTVSNSKKVNAPNYGGAVFLDSKINKGIYYQTNATFNVTKDTVYSGNKVISDNQDYVDTYGNIAKTSGGFMFLDRDAHATFNISEGATLTIGNADAEGNMDSIASSIRAKGSSVKMDDSISKTGAGTLTLNGSLDDYHGIFNQEAGVTNINKNWTATNAINVKGGTLNLKDLTLGSIAKSYRVYKSNSQLDTLQPAEVTKGSLSISSGATVNAGKIISTADETSIDVNGTLNAESIESNGSLTVSGDISATNWITHNAIDFVKGNINGNLVGPGKVNLSGATYTLNSLNQIADGVIVRLYNTGVLSTTSGVIFDTAVQDNKTTATVKDAVKSKITFDSGSLKLTDAEYSLDDITTYKNALIANKADSKTTVVMTGKLKDVKLPENNQVSLDQAASVSNSEGVKVELDQVTVSSSKSEVVIGAATGSENADVASEGFAVKGLDLAAPAEGTAKVTINSGKTVTLGGTTGGDLITVAGQAPAALEVKLDSGNIAVGNEAAADTTTYKLAGTVTLSGDSTLAVNKGTLEVATLETPSGTTTLTGAAKVTTLTAQEGSVINIGSDDKAGDVVIENLHLNGATLFLDPEWKDGPTQDIKDGSFGVISIQSLDGKVVAGRNSTFVLNGTKEEAIATFYESGLTWGPSDTGAAIYIGSPISLNGGALYADPTITSANLHVSPALTAPANSITFNAGSLLMVKGDQVTATAAISGITSATIDSGSKLYVSGATKGQSYKILDGTLGGAEFTDLVSANKLLKLVKDTESSTGSAFNVKAEVDEESAVLNDSALKNIANKVANIESGDQVSPAAELIQNIASTGEEEDSINGLNALASFGEMAGSTHGTFRSARLFMDAAQDHLSIAKHTKEFNEDLWADYIHTRESVDGLSLAKMDADYEGSYNTFIVGHDFYAKDNLVLGAAVSYGTGKISSRNNAISTKNDAKYYGASVYGRKINGKTAYLADVSYLRGDNDITQFNAETVTGSPKVDAFSVGIKAEQEFATDYGTLIPYAGVRYMHLAQGAYTNSKGFAYDQDNQNLFLIPVGVKLTGETSFRGWNVKPMAEVGVIINTGDKDTDGTVTVDGTTDAVNYTIVNGTSLIGKLGVQAEKNAITLGVAYEYQKSSDTSDNRLMFNVGYRF